MNKEQLDRIFNPRNVAIIGASDKRGSVGNSLMENMVNKGFMGTIYPVNNKRKSVLGIKAYNSIRDVPEKIDLAIVAVPAKFVLDVVTLCGKSGVGGLVIISAGFKSEGKKGEDIVKKILEVSKKYSMRIIGPNCLGFIKPSINLNASFSAKNALNGSVAFISQSGALGTSILDWAEEQNVGFSYFISIGDMVDISFHDLIDYFGNDPNTSSIIIYMESLSDARKFLSAARAFSRKKPIIVLKAGKSSQGAKAALSHTGSLVGDDSVFDAAFRRAGIIRVDTVGELFDCARTLSMQESPKGKRLAIITNAGGPAVIATDILMGINGELAKLSDKSFKRLNKVMPVAWSKSNPIDVLGDADASRYKKALEICIKDKNVDGIVVILTPQSMTEPEKTAKEIVKVHRKNKKKTILASWMGDSGVILGRKILEKGGIPAYAIPEDAVISFMNLYKYYMRLRALYETPKNPSDFSVNTKENKKIINKAMKEKRNALSEYESKKFLSNYDIPVTSFDVAKSREDAAKVSKRIGFPVVMKILSKDILHKTDVGGVALNINNSNEARNAYEKIIDSVKKKAPKAKIEGVFIERMEKRRIELLIGSKKDSLFGPVIAFGRGGTEVEIFRDTNTTIPPLNMALSLRLIEETKIYKVLKGYRGMKGVNIRKLQEVLYKFSLLVCDFPEIKEIDINPFSIDEKGGAVLDAKILIDENMFSKKAKPYSHLVISPYPKEFIQSFSLRNGKRAVLRPIKPEDEPMLVDMFKTFSKQTKKFRFFTHIKKITHGELAKLTNIDYDREIAIAAEINESSKKKSFAGVVRLIFDAYNETAKFKIIVADPFQKQGLGDKLMDYAIDIARKRKVKKITAKVLNDNSVAIKMFKKRGFRFSSDEKFLYGELLF